MHEWYQKGFISDASLTKTEQYDSYHAGIYMLTGAGNTAYEGQQSRLVKSAHGYDTYEVALNDPVFTTEAAAATITSVARVSKHPEKAVKLLEYINTDPTIYNLLIHGIEGKHYQKLNDQMISIPIDTRYKCLEYVIGNSFNGYVVYPEPENKNELTLQTHREANSSPILGFVFDTKPVSEEVSQCKSVYDDLYPAIASGIVDPQIAVPEFLAQLERAGSQKVIEEMQRQIDAFLKTK